MNVYSKLKSEELRAEAVVWMVIGPMMLLFLFFFGIGILLVIPVCIVYGLVSFLLFLRTLNTGYMIKSILFLFLMIFVVFLSLTGPGIFTIFTGIMTALSLLWLVIMIINRDYTWRTTELFELAAMPVNEVKNGYTARPMPTDQLCNSLGNIYAGFFRTFAEKKESEILKQLDYVRT